MSFAKIKDDPTNLPTWLVIGLAGCLIAVESAIFLFPAPLEFPMDDAYIHFVYADNLIAHGKLFFSDVNEIGIATTSPLWVFLLAGLHLLGISLPVSAKIMGMVGLTVISGATYVLFRPTWKSPFLLLAVFLIAISGNLIWFSLSGMETILFLALGILALLAYQRGKWKTLGVVLGLMMLTRPEGIILFAAVGLVDLWVNRRLRQELVIALLICTVISAPWYIYLYLRTGYFLPSSAIGKQFTSVVGLDYVASQYPYVTSLVQLRSLVYPFIWLAYLLIFALGGKSLPPPFITNGGEFGFISYAPSYWAIPCWLLIVFPLLIMASRWLFTGKNWARWTRTSNSVPLIILAVWLLMHNIAYMFFMPILGTASRYGAMNHIAIWILLAIGAFKLSQRTHLVRFITGGLLLIAFANTLYWNRVYDANIEHMKTVRIAAAHFVRDSLSMDERCAVFDIGAIRYFSQRSIIDIGGLTNPNLLQWFKDNKSDEFLATQRATCIILPGQSSIDGEGWINFLNILGLDHSSYFKLEKIASFEMDSERWLLGYLPTANQQRSVVIYRIIWTQ